MSDFLSKGQVRIAFAMSSAFAGLALSFSASAGNGSSNSNSASVDVVLVGNIAPQCSIDGGGRIALGELTGHERVEAPFDFSCNVPFELVVRSASGAMVHMDKPHGEGPYSGTLPYRLGISLPTLSPSPVQIGKDFSSSEMLGGAIISSGDAIAAGGGNMLLQTVLPESTDLLAGKYSDSITIVVHPRM